MSAKPKKNRYLRKFKILLKKAVLANDSPEKLARGFAIGVFFGVLPTFGFAAVFSIPIAVLLKANRLTAILGTFVSNPFTTPFYMLWATRIGNFILQSGGLTFSWDIFKLKQLLLISKSLLIGSLVLATSISFLSYGLLILLIPLIRRISGKTGHSLKKV